MTEEVDGGLPAFADAEGAGVAHRVIGDTLPVLEVQLKSGQSVISQGGELSWMSPTITMTTQTAGAGGSGFVGVLKRAVAGGTIFMSQYTASADNATVAFATKLPGRIMPIKIDAENEYMVSRHGYLASTDGVTLNIGFQQKLGVGVFSGNGFILQHIAGAGTAWIELSGELVTYELGCRRVDTRAPGTHRTLRSQGHTRHPDGEGHQEHVLRCRGALPRQAHRTGQGPLADDDAAGSRARAAALHPEGGNTSGGGLGNLAKTFNIG